MNTRVRDMGNDLHRSVDPYLNLECLQKTPRMMLRSGNISVTSPPRILFYPFWTLGMVTCIRTSEAVSYRCLAPPH